MLFRTIACGLGHIHLDSVANNILSGGQNVIVADKNGTKKVKIKVIHRLPENI